MNISKKSFAVAALALSCVILLSCDEKPFEDTPGPLTAALQSELLRRAQHGDAEAAERLGLYRLNDLGLEDRLTLDLLKEWADSDEGGGPAFADVAAKACSKYWRMQAISYLKRYIASKKFTEVDEYSRQTHIRNLAAMQRAVETAPAKCLNL